MKHVGTKPIETERLILRPFIKQDARALYENWASDDEVTRYLTWPAHSDISVSEAILQQWIASYEKDDYYHWAIVLKEQGEPIGGISVVSHNDRVQKAEVGYCIGKKWWHQGIMTEAFQAVIAFLLDEVGMRRVEARHDPRNLYSGAVMRKCGLRLEGTSRASGWNNQGICDECLYAILSEDR